MPEVVIYTRATSVLAAQVEAMLTEAGVRFRTVEVASRDEREALMSRFGAPSFPFVVVDGVYVGGFPEIVRQHAQGALLRLAPAEGEDLLLPRAAPNRPTVPRRTVPGAATNPNSARGSDTPTRPGQPGAPSAAGPRTPATPGPAAVRPTSSATTNQPAVNRDSPSLLQPVPVAADRTGQLSAVKVPAEPPKNPMDEHVEALRRASQESHAAFVAATEALKKP